MQRHVLGKSPKLPLTEEERAKLRSNKMKLIDIAHMDIELLSGVLGISDSRAQYVRGLAQFQTVPSIGPKVAERVVKMGYYALEEIKNEDAAALTDRMEASSGFWEDPCVEDAFRCIVHHANHPESGKSWHDFSEERKQFREEHGYPTTRPTRSWYDNKYGQP
ncbi:helix-hairpin-helix domain-containing protein [Paenibacillus sp. FSL W8-0187]|uniref:helix-hairpin-helix domain-containing protein n=1 Tax=Paenibacillus TaxID=44249 RepID=UPI0030DD9854